MFSRIDRICTKPSILRSSGINANPRLIRPETVFSVKDLAAGVRMPPNGAFQKFGSPRPHETVDPQNFTFAQRQRHIIHQHATAGTGQGHVLGTKHVVAKGMISFFGKIFATFTDHIAHDPVDINVIHGLRAGDHAIAQHSDIVANLDQLFEPVRDIDNAHAVAFEIGDDPKQNIHLCGG
jgi:hypothetical protein